MITSNNQHLGSKIKHVQAGAAGRPMVRPYENGHEHDLVRLLRMPLRHDVAVDHWCWMLMHWRSKPANVWLAAADNRAVFHYGGIPLRFYLDGFVTTVMIFVDAITAPQLRRRGSLMHGASRAFNEWKAQEIAFTLGLPKERWDSRREATGWQSLFPLQWLTRPFRPEVIAAHRFGTPCLRRATLVSALWRRLPRQRSRQDPRIRLQQVTEADGCFNRLWDKLRSAAPFSTVRDSAWVHWRFLSSPARDYEVVLARRGDETVGYYATRIARKREMTSAFLAETGCQPVARGSR